MSPADVEVLPENKRKQRRCLRKLNAAEVLKLAAKGCTTTEIAKHQGANPSSVWRFLQEYQRDNKHIETFKTQRADVFAGLQGEALAAQRRIIGTLDDRVVSALSGKEKAAMLGSLNSVLGTIYDKERLERGKSTENVSIFKRVMGSAFDGSHKSLTDKGSAEDGKATT